jgi:biotin synthase
MNLEEILAWLKEEDEQRLAELWHWADSVRKDTVGDEVHLRGLVEFSNICERACTYCGLRAANRRLKRYRMNWNEILECAAKAYERGYGTLVLQSGEDGGVHPHWLGDLIRTIKERYPLAITLGVGEWKEKNYRLWREQGADRYLLRFETSDPDLFQRIHPARNGNLPNRIQHLKILRNLGYEIGGGVMVGLPGQTYLSLARDIEVFRGLDLDMIGIGPYIPHPHTPLGREFMEKGPTNPEQVPNTELMARKVIALARIVCPESNIPATTALATADPSGFLGGLSCGANVIMPTLTPLAYRRLYEIYPNPIFHTTEDPHDRIMEAIRVAGRRPGVGRGDRNKGLAPRYLFPIYDLNHGTRTESTE